MLFADVVRSMDIAATVEMERLRDIMTDVVERSAVVARRFGGTVEYNGDGVMAIFGAPIALEDHAIRACMAALAIQDEMALLAAEVLHCDEVTLRVRVGLNSGPVIVGDIGSGSLGYAATGRHVGFAQRMEAAAPAGGVMLSESTALLVEDSVVLDEPEWVDVRGCTEPVRARRLRSVRPRRANAGRTEADLVGRDAEMRVLAGLAARTIAGRGGVANVVGSPGIGKSRLARETAARASESGVEVCWTFCESHSADVPFGVVAQLLRVRLGVAELDRNKARSRVREQLSGADPADLLLLDDLLGISGPDEEPPQFDADARRRRLTAMMNAASLRRSHPVLFIIEDAQWIDTASESMLIDFLAVIPRTPSLVLITSRPEYRGAFTRLPDAHTITLEPLDDSDTATLIGELVGSDRSIAELRRMLGEQAAGNPFFAEEMVRELAQRGVLAGEPGRYVCRVDVADVAVPATVQATIEARIDRLSSSAKRTMNAASVIGVRFGVDLLGALGLEVELDELVGTELIDQVRITPSAEYAFRHPLIRAVAYESQLRSDRAEWHRRLAAAIQDRARLCVDENAALIAEHLQFAGELRAAYRWHMRAGAWSTNRDLPAARLSWERAYRIADALPAADADQLAMRIEPRTMLCASDIHAREAEQSQARFAELRQLCSEAGDNVSLAIGMCGPATALMYAGRAREAARLSSEQMALLEATGDLTPAIGLASVSFCTWLGVLEFGEILRWSQIIVELAADDPRMGADYGVASPLAIALGWRGTSRWFLGRPGWRQDLDTAVAMARLSNPETLSGAIAWTYGIGVQYGAVRADDTVMRAAEEAVRTAVGASNDRALGLAAYTWAVGLLQQDSDADRDHGLALMSQAREVWLRRCIRFLIPVTDVWMAKEAARRGDRAPAIATMRRAVDELREGYPFYSVWGIGVLVETLLTSGAERDVAEADGLVDRLRIAWGDRGSAMMDITMLRLSALVTRARGDGTAYRNALRRYRDTAESLGFEGHIAWSAALAQSVSPDSSADDSSSDGGSLSEDAPTVAADWESPTAGVAIDESRTTGRDGGVACSDVSASADGPSPSV